MKKIIIVALILMSSCAKSKVNPKFDKRILSAGTKCTISPDAIGSDDGTHSNHVTVDSMSWDGSHSNYYIVAVTTDDGKHFDYPDEDLIDCK